MFGETWRLRSEERMFTQINDSHNDSFKPEFLDNYQTEELIIQGLFHNNMALFKAANDTCGALAHDLNTRKSYLMCLFDIAKTNSTMVGNDTVGAVLNHEQNLAIYSKLIKLL